MMLKNIIHDKAINEVWYKEYFEICKSRVSSEAYKNMISEIHKFIDVKLKSNTKIIVKDLLPKKTYLNTTWEEAFTQACAYDDCYADQFVGLLLCQELISRDETWYFIEQKLSFDMVYFRK